MLNKILIMLVCFLFVAVAGTVFSTFQGNLINPKNVSNNKFINSAKIYFSASFIGFLISVIFIFHHEGFI